MRGLVLYLVALLGSPNFATREAAQRALEVLTTCSEEAARSLPKIHRDPEVRHRLRGLIWRAHVWTGVGRWRLEGGYYTGHIYELHRDGSGVWLRGTEPNPPRYPVGWYPEGPDRFCVFTQSWYESYKRGPGGSWTCSGPIITLTRKDP